MQVLAAGWPCPVWSEALALLQPAIDHGGETNADELAAMLEAGTAQLWVTDDLSAALVTTRHGDCLHLWLCGGSGGDWPALLRQIMDFTRQHGVTRWSVDGRRGWLRVLKGA